MEGRLRKIGNMQVDGFTRSRLKNDIFES